jgi:ATP-dependent DNA helicase RecQ
LYDRALQRERREIARLGQVAAWVEHDGCQVAALGAHFGDPMREPCGHCSWCQRGRRASRLPPRPPPRIDEEQWSRAVEFRRQNGETLRDARSLARFLCGVSSPRMIRAKLQSHPLFGTFSRVPFPAILERAES